jgi:hypothetical protein
MTRLLFCGGVLADLGAALLHLPSGYEDDWSRVVVATTVGLLFSGAWRTLHLMLEVTEPKLGQVRIR